MSSDNVVLLAEPGELKCSDHLVDLFCGCGGSGGGLLDANSILQRQVRGTFVNHWDKAIEIHEANHPEHRHMEEDIFLLDPTTVFPVGTNCSLIWASPSCTHFSVARGAACVSEQGRSHAFTVTDWVKHLGPEAVICENVAEFLSFGPVIQKRRWEAPRKGELIWAKNSKPVKELPRGYNRRRKESEEDWTARMKAEGYEPYMVPDKERAGEYFDQWIAEMDELGYDSEHKVLCSADYGDPTIRKRLFVYFVRRTSGKKIVWPIPYAQDHKRPEKYPEKRPMYWRTAEDCIDWTVKGESVFTRKKKLADNTFRRLAIGLVKYGLRDFLVSSAHTGGSHDSRVHAKDEPVKTLTCKGERGVVQAEAYIVPQHGGHKKDYVKGVDHPMSAVTTTMSGEGLVVPMISTCRGTSIGHAVDEPVRALTAGGGHQALAEAFMFAIDQSGGTRKNDGTYSVKAPVRTLVTKANQACIEMELEEVSERFISACDAKGVDTERAAIFLQFLVEELEKRGKIEAKPWIYVYYSSGSEGKSIDEPLPACRTKAGHALVYPVIELHGRRIKIDLLYRMLMVKELQKAMGFPEEMSWGSATKTEQIRAIGNSVSRGVSRALGLAWYSQDENVWEKVKHLPEYEEPDLQ